MAHLIDRLENGNYTFARRTGSEDTWHGLGQQCDTLDQAFESVGADYCVITENAYDRVVDQDGKESFLELPDVQIIKAVDKERKLLNRLGSAKGGYNPTQNETLKTIAEKFTQYADFETMAVLDEYKKYFILLKLDTSNIESRFDSNDKINRYILLSNSHDGTSALRIGYTTTRVVCNNTLQVAHKSDLSQLIRLKHTKNSGIALDILSDTMAQALDTDNAGFKVFLEQYHSLKNCPIYWDDAERYFNIVYDYKNIDDESKRGKTMRQNHIDALNNLFYNGAGNEGKTLADAYNAVTEYETHEKPTKGTDNDPRKEAERRKSNLLFLPQGAALLKKAMDQALAFAR